MFDSFAQWDHLLLNITMYLWVSCAYLRTLTEFKCWEHMLGLFYTDNSPAPFSFAVINFSFTFYIKHNQDWLDVVIRYRKAEQGQQLKKSLVISPWDS